jgi:hypothetical protein
VHAPLHRPPGRPDLRRCSTGLGPRLDTSKPASWSNSDLKAAIPANRAAPGSARLLLQAWPLPHLIRACAPGGFPAAPRLPGALPGNSSNGLGVRCRHGEPQFIRSVRMMAEYASPRRFAPIDLTADVPAGQRPVRACKLPGRAFACWRASNEPRSTWCPSRSGPRHIFNTESRIKNRP